MTSPDQRHYRTCHLCEAMCGIEIDYRDNEILAIRGDENDPFSKGHICPKAAALADLHKDPDRLRKPVRRTVDGWEEISWDQAFKDVVDHLVSIREHYGSNAVGIYAGNPNVHSYGQMLCSNVFLKQLKTRNRFSATSVDQLPHHLASYWMFGHQFLIPIPDVDRTEFFLILGANPIASNGSLMSAPGIRRRLLDMKKRGGKLVVIDPRRTETAAIADKHHFIRPGTDALLLASLLRCIIEDDLVNPGPLVAYMDDLGEALVHLEPFTAEVAAGICGIPEADIRALARTFATSPSAVAYGRMGCSTQPFGTLCQWLINLLNIVTGNLDHPGGAMFTKPAFDMAGPKSRPGHYGAWHSRVRNLPEFGGELPCSAMAEEILTPGEDQIKAMVTVAGNPVLSTPDGAQLDKAFEQLEFMVSVDFYINETTRHANIILPPVSPLERDHFDVIFGTLAIRNVAKYSPALFPKPEGTLHDWEIFAQLAERMARRLGNETKPFYPPQVMLDQGLSFGPYGAQQGAEEALNLEKLKQHPHGLDLGPLIPMLPDRISGETKRIQCAPKPLIDDLERLEAFIHQPPPPLVLIGRRHLRSNNSWMHNVPSLVKGKPICVLLMHPYDAHLRSLNNGQEVTVKARVGEVTAKLEVSEDLMPGVVCLPHGFGHQRKGVKLSVASKVEGPSINDLTDPHRLDDLSGNAALNGTPVEVV